MEEMAPRRNNLSPFFLHLDVALTGGVGGQVARSSHRSVDPVRFVSGGWRSALLRVAVASAAVGLFDVLQLGTWMMTCSCVPLLRLCWMNLTASGSGDHSRSLADVPQSLGLVACDVPVHRLEKHPCMRRCSPRSGYSGCSPLFRRFLHGGGGLWWTTVRRGTNFSKGGI